MPRNDPTRAQSSPFAHSSAPENSFLAKPSLEGNSRPLPGGRGEGSLPGHPQIGWSQPESSESFGSGRSGSGLSSPSWVPLDPTLLPAASQPRLARRAPRFSRNQNARRGPLGAISQVERGDPDFKNPELGVSGWVLPWGGPGSSCPLGQLPCQEQRMLGFGFGVRPALGSPRALQDAHRGGRTHPGRTPPPWAPVTHRRDPGTQPASLPGRSATSSTLARWGGGFYARSARSSPGAGGRSARPESSPAWLAWPASTAAATGQDGVPVPGLLGLLGWLAAELEEWLAKLQHSWGGDPF